MSGQEFTGTEVPQEFLDNFEFQISITFPGEVKSATGAVDGNTVTWEPKIGENTRIEAVASAIPSVELTRPDDRADRGGRSRPRCDRLLPHAPQDPHRRPARRTGVRSRWRQPEGSTGTPSSLRTRRRPPAPATARRSRRPRAATAHRPPSERALRPSADVRVPMPIVRRDVRVAPHDRARGRRDRLPWRAREHCAINCQCSQSQRHVAVEHAPTTCSDGLRPGCACCRELGAKVRWVSAEVGT